MKKAVGIIGAMEVEVEFLKGDLFEALQTGGKNTRTKYDMIVSNPPYIRTNLIALLQEEVKDHEPLAALDGGVDGLDFYRRIVADAHNYLKSDGCMMLEIGYDQGEDVTAIFAALGYKDTEVIKDLAGLDRVVCCCYES